ncbi:RNA-binding protein 44 isoform X3 [Ictalurus punctatus]|uniref:RNA-binding protein 44 isoform X3 n=1 Tax=Ictalurus punctatus TaxID=7998 RepID=A0A2D0R503_ICTPU|nr:RNA-binding protein 44 isoform X3 [Ictalurus punctatus]
MWYPSCRLVPIYFEPNVCRSADVPAAVMWPVIPLDQHMCLAVNDMVGYQEHCFSVADGRKFLLSKSVFDLVNVSHFLEFTDPKLLGWYVSLPEEDRQLIQEEGGLIQFLHRHPALEVSRHVVCLKRHVIGTPLPEPDMSSKLERSRRATSYGVSECVNCRTSCPSGTKKCRRCSTLVLNTEENVCVLEEEKSLRLLPNNVREELNLLKAKGDLGEDMSVSSYQQFDSLQGTANNLSTTWSNPLNRFQQPGQPRKNSSDGQLLCQMWEESVRCDGNDIRVLKDPSAQASFLLDRELEMQGHSQNSDDDQVPLLPDNNSAVPNLEEETLPEYYSFNSTTMGHTSAQWSDATNTSMMATKGSTEASTADELVACDVKNGTFPDSLSFHSNSSEWTDLSEDCQNLSNEDDLECETKTDEYHSVIEEASSSAACVNPSWSASGQCTREREFTCEGCISSPSLNKLNVKTTTACEVSPVSLHVSQAVDASNDFRACFTSTGATEITQDLLAMVHKDVSTDTDSCLVNEETQTTQRPTSEKYTVTEIYMSDLDALCEEFGNLRKMEKELMHLKDDMARSGPGTAGGPKSERQKSHCGCGAVPRARLAELRLLALQFAMCQQHCWRCFYTSPQGETSLQGTEALLDAMSQTLKSLEDRYLKMKMMILEGVPLDNLKPLSVDTKRLTAATCYRPSLIYEAFLGDGKPEFSFKPSHLEDEGQTNQVDEVLNINLADRGHFNKNTTAHWHDSATSSKTAISKRCRGGMPGSSQQPGVSTDAKPGAPKELHSSDAWFDAEEELGCDRQSCKEDQQTGQRDQGNSKKELKVRSDQCFLLCVSNLPNSVTEHDLLLWFAKYHASQVSFSKFSNGAAVLSVRNPKDAEAAVREMNGRSIQGHTLHVEHILKSPTDSQATIKEPCVHLAPAALKAGSVGKRSITHSSNNNVHTSRPFRCSLDKLTNICPTPTASGTCVPQHYGTMGSFDTIMAQLSERHPKMGRQQIVSALLELREKHHGVLSGLPLREIVDMTSELLTHSTTD